MRSGSRCLSWVCLDPSATRWCSLMGPPPGDAQGEPKRKSSHQVLKKCFTRPLGKKTWILPSGVPSTRFVPATPSIIRRGSPMAPHNLQEDRRSSVGLTRCSLPHILFKLILETDGKFHPERKGSVEKNTLEFRATFSMIFTFTFFGWLQHDTSSVPYGTL